MFVTFAKGVLLVLLVAVVAGCASTADTSAASGPPANAAGTWDGWAGVGGVSAHVSLTLTQTGSSVKGEMAVGGSPDLTGPVTGIVQGNLLTLQTSNGTRLTPMTVHPSQITGVISPGPVMLQRVQ